MNRDEMNVGMLVNELPQGGEPDVSGAWNRLRVRMRESETRGRTRWSPLRAWSVATAGALAVAAALVVTVAPIRAWAENLLAIFRVEHVAVLDLNSVSSLENNQVFNQAMTHILSDSVTVTQPPEKPQPVPDAATASRLAGFKAHLLAGQTPNSLMVRSTITAQMKLDRDRLQSILDEAGRSDIRIPSSVDGAVVGLRVPAGIMASYGNCGEPVKLTFKEKGWGARLGVAPATRSADGTCAKLNELPSPTASFPSEIDPAEIAKVGLEAAGLSPTEAANFTQTVDWTTTLVVPVLHGQTAYERVNVNGIEAVLLRPRMAGNSGRFNVVWVDNGIIYNLMGSGDDTAAINLASQIE